MNNPDDTIEYLDSSNIDVEHWWYLDEKLGEKYGRRF